MLYIFVDDLFSERNFDKSVSEDCLKKNLAEREKAGKSTTVDRILLEMARRRFEFRTLNLHDFYENDEFKCRREMENLRDEAIGKWGTCPEDSVILDYFGCCIDGTCESFFKWFFDVEDIRYKDLCLIITDLPMKYDDNYISGEAWFQFKYQSDLDLFIEDLWDKRKYSYIVNIIDSDSFYDLFRETIFDKYARPAPENVRNDVVCQLNKFLNGLLETEIDEKKVIRDKDRNISREVKFYKHNYPLQYFCFYEDENDNIMYYKSNNGDTEDQYETPGEETTYCRDKYKYVTCYRDGHSLGGRLDVVIKKEENVCPACNCPIDNGYHQVLDQHINYYETYNSLLSKKIYRTFKSLKPDEFEDLMDESMLE